MLTQEEYAFNLRQIRSIDGFGLDSVNPMPDDPMDGLSVLDFPELFAATITIAGVFPALSSSIEEDLSATSVMQVRLGFRRGYSGGDDFDGDGVSNEVEYRNAELGAELSDREFSTIDYLGLVTDPSVTQDRGDFFCPGGSAISLGKFSAERDVGTILVVLSVIVVLLAHGMYRSSRLAS